MTVIDNEKPTKQCKSQPVAQSLFQRQASRAVAAVHKVVHPRTNFRMGASGGVARVARP